MEKYQKAEADYMAGMKYKDIAEKYKTTINTVKSWKKRYGWERTEGAHKKEKGCTQKKGGKSPPVELPDDGTKETLQNADLSTEWQMFCIYYSRTFNAAQSYQKVYGCTYESAMVRGCELLRNVKVKKELERLKEIKRQQIVASEEDIVELQMRIAFSDMGNYVQFGGASVSLVNSELVDTQLIKKVKKGKDGISIEIEDKQKAMSWLTKYFLLHPNDKYKAEFDKKRAEVNDNSEEEILKNMQTLAEILQKPEENREISDFEESDG